MDRWLFTYCLNSHSGKYLTVNEIDHMWEIPRILYHTFKICLIPKNFLNGHVMRSKSFLYSHHARPFIEQSEGFPIILGHR